MAEISNILQELNELESSLAVAPRNNTYRVPAGYFEELAAQVLKRLQALDAASVTEELAFLSPLLSQAPRKTPYTVPTGYFEKLELSLPVNTSQSAQEEIETLSPLLSSLKKQAPYSVPQGYFDSLPATTVAAKEKETATGARVIKLGNRNWVRYAVAALLVGFVATGALFLFNRESRIDPATKSFAWVEKNMKKVSTDDINAFVELAKDEAPLAQVTVDTDIQSLMKDVSDKEIQEFLNDTQPAEPDDDDEDILLN